MSSVISIDVHRDPLGRRLIPLLLILGLTFLAYAPIIRAGFIWDDDKHVTENQLLQSAHGLWTLWAVRDALPQYYPLTHTFFWIEQHLWGNNPLGYHLINVILHACNAALVWRLLKRLAIPGALLASLLFALHPVNVETAAWVSERKNTLSGLFYLLSLCCYVRLPPLSNERRWKWCWYLGSFALFICALLSKTVTSTLPAVVLLLIYFRVGRIQLKDAWRLVPFFVVGIVAGANTAWLERTHVGASGPEWRFAATIPGEIIARILIAGRVICFYFWKLLIPYPLMFEYPRWHIDITAAGQYVFPIVVAAALAMLWFLRKRLGRGPLCAMLFFAGTLFPALGINNIYPMRFSFVADHFQYLASIGPLTLIAAGLYFLVVRNRVFRVVPFVIVGSLMLLTLNRVNTFRSEEILYTDSIEKNPNGWMTQSNLGALFIADNKLDEAQSHLQIALALHPNNAIAALRMAQVAQQRNDYPSMLIWSQRAEQMEPTMGEPHSMIAQVREASGDIDGALAEFAVAQQLQPNNAPSRLKYGVLLSHQHRYAEAVVQFDEAVRIDPRSTVARTDRLAALERAGYFDRAADELHSMISTDPTAVLWRDLGIVETLRHHPQQAIDAFSESLRINPDQPETQQRLNAVMRSMSPSSP